MDMAAAFERTAMLVGADSVQALCQKRVAVFGLGGVGGHVCEALARCGIGALDLFDNDIVCETNLNRQLVALRSTLGMPKTKAMALRIADINPLCHVRTHQVFYLPQNADGYPLDVYDYVVDAVDTISAKLEIIARSKAAGVPVVSVMGAGNKLRPELFCVADISKTSVDPLARVIRKELKKRGISGVQVVYSTEEPRKPTAQPAALCPPDTRKPPLGSISFVPSAAGLVAASAVVRALLGYPQ